MILRVLTQMTRGMVPLTEKGNRGGEVHLARELDYEP